MSKLLDEIVSEVKDNLPPEDAITSRQLSDETGEAVWWCRKYLNKKVDEEGWEKIQYGKENYYWKPAH